MSLSEPQKIKQQWRTAMSALGKFDRCALLDHPNHSNIGDNLIWLGEVFYLKRELGVDIAYACDSKNFSAQEMEERAGKSPILLHGGGNLGDLWTFYQKFRESIIQKYRDRPIFILPQTIYFKDPANIQPVADIFNAHGNLTIFVRDDRSYEIATTHFQNCRIVKSPDAAFEMVDMPGPALAPPCRNVPLYLARKDREANQAYAIDRLNVPDLVADDWGNHIYHYTPTSRAWTPAERLHVTWENKRQWISRQLWKFFHPYASALDGSYDPQAHRKSWVFMHHGIFQLLRYRPIIANRLHGHILCVLLGVPHVLLPNTYYKNESFYQAWTANVPYCRFVKDIDRVRDALQELKELYPQGAAHLV